MSKAYFDFVDCNSHCRQQCGKCKRNIGLGMPYTRVVKSRPDDDGVLQEVSRFPLCSYCAPAARDEHGP